MSLILQGSTSGSVTLQEPAVAGTTVLTLPAVTGTVLTDTSPKAGNVIQVVNATYNVEVSNTTTTYSDTGLTASITPSSSSSKILVIVSQTDVLSPSVAGVKLQLLRGATSILVFAGYIGDNGSTTVDASASCNYLDSPATTSSVTYKTQFARQRGSGTVYVQNGGVGYSSITLMEIAA
jgi:hypothetical protein